MEDDKKMTEGEIEEVINEEVTLVEDLNEPQKGIPPELEKMIRAKISQMSNGVFSEQEEDEIYDSFNEKDILSSKEKEILEDYLNTEIRKIIIEKLRKKNKDNESFKEQQEEQQKEDEEEKQQEEQVEQSSQEDLEKVSEEEQEKEEEQEEEQNVKEDEKLPAEVIEACERIGINKIKGYFYVNASQLKDKVDNTLVDKYGEKVLMLEVSSEKIEGPNKYYGFQENKMVLYGNEDEAVRDVTGKTRMGEVVEPLKMKEPKEVKFDNKDGMVVNEQIDDNSKLSVQEANNYRDEMEELLEEYSREVEAIKSNDDLTKEEKAEKLLNLDGNIRDRANKIAQNNDIGLNDRENIDNKIKGETKENIGEIDKDDEEKQKVLGPNEKYGY